MSAEYERRRAAMARAAADEHAKWLSSLSPEERKQVEGMGLGRASTDSHQVSGRATLEKCDAAETSRSSIRFDPSRIDSYADQLADSFDLDDVTAIRLARHIQTVVAENRDKASSEQMNAIIGTLIRAENVKTSAAGLAFAVGMADLNNFGSIRTYAKKNGLSPAAISKQRVKWEILLRLPPSIHAKSPESRHSFSRAQKRKHWRGQKFRRNRPPTP